MKHWIFDFDGTLFDTVGPYHMAVEKIFAIYGLPFGPQVLVEAMRYFDPNDFFALYLEPRFVKEAVAHLIRLNHEHADDVREFPGIRDLLESLRGHDLALSVWTARERETAVRILANTKLDHHFERCVSGTCVSKRKPHPEGLLKILKESKHRNDEVVMIGDHEYDMSAAREVGVKAVSVSWADPKMAEKMAALSDHHFHRVADFKEWALGHYR